MIARSYLYDMGNSYISVYTDIQDILQESYSEVYASNAIKATARSKELCIAVGGGMDWNRIAVQMYIANSSFFMKREVSGLGDHIHRLEKHVATCVNVDDGLMSFDDTRYVFEDDVDPSVTIDAYFDDRPFLRDGFGYPAPLKEPLEVAGTLTVLVDVHARDEVLLALEP